MVEFDGERYSDNSEIQNEQSLKLFRMIDKNIDSNDINDIIDIGCGDGKVTRQLINAISPRRLIAVDKSQSQINIARDRLKNIELMKTFRQGDIADMQFEVNFDMIFSNAALHWVKDQQKLYSMLSKIIRTDGFIAVHQGGKGSYEELHKIAVQTLEDFGYSPDEVTVPLQYYNIDEIKGLLNSNNFEDVDIRMEESVVNTNEQLAKAFSEASLLPYRNIVEQEDEYIESFVQNAQGFECSINRLYFIGKR